MKDKIPCDKCKHQIFFEDGWRQDKKGHALGLLIQSGCNIGTNKIVKPCEFKAYIKRGCGSFKPKRK
jgi:hypothetical protein